MAGPVAGPGDPALPDPGAEADPARPGDAALPHPDQPETEGASGGWRGKAAVAAGLLLLLGGGVTAAVWAGRLDPGLVPIAGPALARLEPGPSKLVIEARARLTPLPSGAMLLEVDGVVRNTGTVRARAGVLKATLESPAGVVRRWSIAVPADNLAPGAEARFQSTLAEVPGSARTLRLVSG